MLRSNNVSQISGQCSKQSERHPQHDPFGDLVYTSFSLLMNLVENKPTYLLVNISVEELIAMHKSKNYTNVALQK